MSNRKRILCLVGALALLAGCTQEAADDSPKPWAAPSTVSETLEAETETTRQAELETMEAFTVDAASITLPSGVTSDDIAQLESALWVQMFYADYDCTTANLDDAMCYLTDGNVPWGLLSLVPALDPNGQIGTYAQHSVVEEPDPKGIFFDEYFKADASLIDFLLADVLHIAPDPNGSGEGWYRDGDYYYFSSYATGMEGQDIQVRACQKLPNGHYKITAELLCVDPGSEPEHECSAYLETDLSEKNGVRYWSIYNIKTFE